MAVSFPPEFRLTTILRTYALSRYRESEINNVVAEPEYIRPSSTTAISNPIERLTARSKKGGEGISQLSSAVLYLVAYHHLNSPVHLFNNVIGT
jgi:hypothetical protein